MKKVGGDWISTTVEITIGYLTAVQSTYIDLSTTVEITIGYLTASKQLEANYIYNSRNYYRLLNENHCKAGEKSTTVEITIGYLTRKRKT